MEGFQLPTSAILILSQGSGWHGNLILGKRGEEGGGGGGDGGGCGGSVDGGEKKNAFRHSV